MSRIKTIITTLLLPSLVMAAPISDYQFKSPAFNGVGYSSHVLTIENLEATRQKAREDAIQAAIDKAAAEKKNTNLSKFISNLESRIYAQISQNLATSMFANGACKPDGTGTCSGSIDFQGNYISWGRVSNAQDANCPGSGSYCVLLKVADPTAINPTTAGCNDAGMSCVYVPLNAFQLPGL